MTSALLGGRYLLMDTVGEGGMAVVYRAKDTLLNRIVAVKVLRPQYASDAEFRERFRREAQSAAGLSHPNIVNVYDVGEDSGSNYIVMEWVNGQTLHDIIVRDGRLTVEQTVSLSSQILDALEHAHANGIIHRDIKPQNILLTVDGRVKVADFGIARAASSSALTETGKVVGTVNYTSPEQAQGEPATAESDVYSLGVVMYEMLTGRPPFAGDTPVAVALKHVRENPIPIRAFNPAVPPELERAILRALEKEPRNRWCTARSFRTGIARAMAASRVAGSDQGRVVQDSGLDEGQGRRDAPAASIVVPAAQAGPSAGLAVGAAKGGAGDGGGSDLLSTTRPFELVGEATDVNDDRRARGRRSGSAKVWLAILAVLLIVSVAILVVLKTFVNWMNVAEVPVPNLVGKSLPEAETVARRAKLSLDSSVKRYDESVPYNHVIEQDPDEGAIRKVNSVVKVIVSLGAEMVTVPDLFNKSIREATLDLERVGLQLGEQGPGFHEDVPVGRIMSQDPEVGAFVPKGARVDVLVSSGPPPPPVEVPLVIGMTLDQARETLENAGFVVGEVTTRPSSMFASGTVISQYPGSFRHEAPGTPIDLVIAEGGEAGKDAGQGAGQGAVTWPWSERRQSPPSTPNVPTLPSEPPEAKLGFPAGTGGGDAKPSGLEQRRFEVAYTVGYGADSQEIVIKVIDGYGERISYGPKSHKPGDYIRHVAEVYGPGKIEVWVDGVLIRVENV